MKLFELFSVKQFELQLPATTDENTKQQLLDEILSSYIAILFYCGVSNIMTQAQMPTLEQLQQDSPIKNLLDQSYNDFNYINQLIAQADQSRLEKSPLNNLYHRAISLAGDVVNSTEYYRLRATPLQSTT